MCATVVRWCPDLAGFTCSARAARGNEAGSWALMHTPACCRYASCEAWMLELDASFRPESTMYVMAPCSQQSHACSQGRVWRRCITHSVRALKMEVAVLQQPYHVQLAACPTNGCGTSCGCMKSAVCRATPSPVSPPSLITLLCFQVLHVPHHTPCNDKS